MKTSVLEKMIKTEFSGSIERNDLIDWFVEKQNNGCKFNHEITVKDLITAAEGLGIEVTREKNKRIIMPSCTSIGYMQRTKMTYKKGVSIPERAVNHITKLYKEHTPVTKIARLYNVSSTTVREFIKKHDITKEALDKAVIRKRKKVFN